jgi:hypothetical protein
MTMTTDDHSLDSQDDTDDLAEAAREAELARASFSASVRTASASGVHAVQRAAARAKPLLIGALVVGGAAVLVAAARLVKRPRRHEWLAPPRSPGIVGSLVRTAVTRLVLLGVAHVAERYLQPKLEEAGRLPPAGVAH